MNSVVRQQLDQPMSIAVASTAGHDVAGEIANAIALTRANQGATTVLVQADLHRSDDETPGLADYLGSEQSADVGSILRPASDGLALISSGRPREVPSALFDRRRTAALIDDLRERAELVVVESPPLDSCSEAQVISDVTDGTLLIIEQGSRCDDAREAIRVLDQVGATLVGVVLAARPAASSRIESQTHNPA
jgi:non-specific protein-tyrosine kinase